jgi:hypothetical protein
VQQQVCQEPFGDTPTHAMCNAFAATITHTTTTDIAICPYVHHTVLAATTQETRSTAAVALNSNTQQIHVALKHRHKQSNNVVQGVTYASISKVN